MKCFFSLMCCIVIFVPNVYAADCEYGNIMRSMPDNRFIDNEDGTVSDKKTGLMWKKCTEGLSGEGCSQGQVAWFSFGSALGYMLEVETFAGYDDWRIPNIKELFSIVEDACTSPAINEVIFPNTESWFYLTSTSGYEIDYGNGNVNSEIVNRYYSRHVRLVRDLK